MKQFRH